MESCGKELIIKETKKAMDAANFAKEGLQSQGIISVGGDGTLQEVVSGMLDGQDKCDTPLCAISCGSGNDWQRSLNSSQTLEARIQSIIAGKTRAIDAIRANNMGLGLASINIANIGLDVEIVKRAQPLKKIFGKNSYVVSALISIAKHKNHSLTVFIDDKEAINGDFTLVAICNGQYYGGNMRITPSAIIDDGKITLCLVKGLSRSKILMLFPLMLLEKHTKLKDIEYIECKKVTIISNNRQSLSLDGNIYEIDKPLNFEILPNAIQIFE